MLSDIGTLLIGTVAALLAAAAFGASSILQFRASREVPQEPAGRPILFVKLIRQADWRWSVLLAIVAFGLQITALSLIPLILVQPLLITSLLWYVLFYALMRHVRPDRPTLLESGLCLLGLSAFLLVARPAPGGTRVITSGWLPVLLGVTVLGAVGLCLLLALGLGRRWRPLPLAVAAGICYGVTAGLVSSLAFKFQENPAALLGHWQIYAIAVLGPFGVLLSQNAYQAGPMGAPALAAITVTDPLVAIGVGLLWLGERIQVDTWRTTGEVLALGLLATGVFLLARRAPQVSGAREDSA